MDSKYANAISEENTLESNIANRPVPKFVTDPKYVKEFKQPTSSFPENYAIVSMIGSDEVYHNFDVFCVSKFMKSYLVNKYETAVRVLANKYNKIFLTNMDRKMNDMRETVMNEFKDIKDDDVESAEKIRDKLLSKITDVNDYLNTIFEAVKMNENLPEENVKNLVETECNVSYDTFETEYQVFHDDNLAKLQEDFRKIEDYSGPIISAFKIRGIHDTLDNAKEHAKKLYDLEPYVDTYIANVGEWAAWTASRSNVQDVVYMDKSLSKLMKRYTDNINKANGEFDARRKACIEHQTKSKKEEIKRKVKEQSK